MNLINQNKYYFTQNEFIRFVSVPKAEFLRRVRTFTVTEALNRRRALQSALTDYSRTHGVDLVAIRTVRMTMKLEKMARLAYLYYQMKQLFQQYPAWSRAARKIEAKRQWEQFIKINSY